MAGPRAFIQDNPTRMSVRLGGKYVNLTLLAEYLHIDHGYLCRVIAGGRNPSAEYIRKVAAALRMSVDDLLQAIDDIKHNRDSKDTKSLQHHFSV